VKFEPEFETNETMPSYTPDAEAERPTTEAEINIVRLVSRRPQ